MQALGLNTVCVNSVKVLESLEINDAVGILTTELELSERQLELEAMTAKRVVTIPKPEYGGGELSGVPLFTGNTKTGGHILYTSGTTGNYKKVFLEEELQQQRNAERIQIYHHCEADTVYHCTGFGLWTGVGYKRPLYVWQMGGCIILEQRPQWYQYFLQSGMTNTILIPGQVQQLLSFLEDQPSKTSVEDFYLLIAGGFVSRNSAEQLLNHVSGYLENIYGSTEINVPVLRSTVTSLDDLHWLLPTEYRIVEIVDEVGKLCPVDVEGALRVRLSELDCSSYLGDLQASEKVFKDGCFYPGDMAVRRADGRIRILGRSADVVNFRGQKVSVAPIEDKIQIQLGVDTVCLFSGINSADEEEVVIAIESDHWPDKSDLNNLGHEFAQFDQVRFAIVYPFPRTQTGTSKIDRIALRKLVFPGD
jgi:acyl-coenzyme A synthetase/AMP-(fatty) acid ligase